MKHKRTQQGKLIYFGVLILKVYTKNVIFKYQWNYVMYCSCTVYYHVFLCIITTQLSKKELTVKCWYFLNRKLLSCNMHRNIMTATKINTVIKIFDDYNGEYNKYIELWIWFLLWSKLEHYSDGGDDTDGIDNQPINYLDGDNHIMKPIIYIYIILYFQNQIIPLTCNDRA